jgi:hypothetical protein
VNPVCEALGCAKRPSFGFLGERPRRCKAHLLEGMVRTLAQRHRQVNCKVANLQRLCSRRM